MKKILIFGPGWIGNKLKDYLKADLSRINIADISGVSSELDSFRPDVVINAAGKTGRPNIDWCEEHKQETIASNIIGPLVLLKECLARNILLVHLSSGCIFDGLSSRSSGFSEEDEPRPVSFYAWTKAKTDELLKEFPVLILRLRMPIDTEPNPRNLITKLTGYQKVIDVENSVTIVDDFLFAVKRLIEKGKTGIYNVVNPGTVKHKDILNWYKEIVDGSHYYELIDFGELQKLGLTKTGRSNCILDTSKLESEGIILQNVKEGVLKCLKEYKLKF